MAAAITKDPLAKVVSILHIAFSASFMMDCVSKTNHAFTVGSHYTSRKDAFYQGHNQARALRLGA